MKEQSRVLTRSEKSISSVQFDVGYIKIGNKEIKVYIASTSTLRKRGLQNAIKMGDDVGMLFIFPYPYYPTMHNQFLKIPLDVAFIDGNFFIRDIQEMRIFSEGPQRVRSRVKSIFALEMNKDWFKKNGVEIQTQMEIIKI